MARLNARARTASRDRRGCPGQSISSTPLTSTRPSLETRPRARPVPTGKRDRSSLGCSRRSARRLGLHKLTLEGRAFTNRGRPEAACPHPHAKTRPRPTSDPLGHLIDSRRAMISALSASKSSEVSRSSPPTSAALASRSSCGPPAREERERSTPKQAPRKI